MKNEIQNSQIPPSIVVQEWAKTIKDKSNVIFLKRQVMYPIHEIETPKIKI